MKFTILFRTIIASSFVLIYTNHIQSQDGELVFEEVIVTAEKRDESLQSVSQAVTAITDSEISAKNITSFVDLSTIVPGVTVAKNEGYKTIISIRVLVMKQIKMLLQLLQLPIIWMVFLLLLHFHYKLILLMFKELRFLEVLKEHYLDKTQQVEQ